MPILKEIKIESDQVIKLVNQLNAKEKFKVLKGIIHDENYWREYYVFTEKLAKEKGFDSMTEKELEDLLHEK